MDNVGFFFQAEDGIRDVAMTGVQTCALPIWSPDGEYTGCFNNVLVPMWSMLMVLTPLIF